MRGTKTIADIAQELGLNRSTVGHALTGKGTISQKTRQRVIEYAQKIGYRPNRLAQRMRSRQTRTIGLVVPDVKFAYVDVVQSLFREVAKTGRELQIGLTEFTPELEQQSLQMMIDSQVDGIILKTSQTKMQQTEHEAAINEILERRIPMVFYGRPPVADLPHVLEPWRPAAKMVGEHLLSLGHQRICMLIPHVPPYTFSVLGRLDGLREAYRDRQLPLDLLTVSALPPGASLPRSGGYMEHFDPSTALDIGRWLFRRAMEQSPRPTAVVGYSDAVSIGALLEAQAMGLRIPQDIAIAGTQLVATSYCAPLRLTTVDWHPVPFARELLAVLDAILQGDTGVPLLREGDCSLVVGATTVGG